MRKTIEAGLAIRGKIRDTLLLNEIDFIEDRHFLYSVFYLKCSDDIFDILIETYLK